MGRNIGRGAVKDTLNSFLNRKIKQNSPNINHFWYFRCRNGFAFLFKFFFVSIIHYYYSSAVAQALPSKIGGRQRQCNNTRMRFLSLQLKSCFVDDCLCTPINGRQL